MRESFFYVKSAHSEMGGRRGSPQDRRPNSERTVKDYHTHRRSLFNWLVKDECLSFSLLEKIEVPISRDDQIQPFSEQQITALLGAAGRLAARAAVRPAPACTGLSAARGSSPGSS